MALEGDLDTVRGGGDGPDEETDLADVAAGVAVQGEHLVDPDQPAAVDDLVGPAGDDLLRRLEDQPHAEAGGRERLLLRREGQSRAEDDRRMQVVAAGVRHALGRGGPGQAGPVRHRKGVEVRAERNPVCGFWGAEVDDDTAAVEQRRNEPGRCQPVRDGVAGPGLEAGELGVRVEVPTDVDELGIELVDGGMQDGKQRVHVGGHVTRPVSTLPPMSAMSAAAPEHPVVVAAEVRAALADGRGVVALESTILAHGLPRGDNRRVAEDIEGAVRAGGAVPATVAVLDGMVRVGLTADELDRLCLEDDVLKLSARDLGVAVALRRTGATTVASTATVAHHAGVRVFATGGLGGVHRGAAETFDISADLGVLATTPLVVVCAGVKSILDVPATLERLETLSVPVLGYRTDRFPGFYLTDSGSAVPWRVESAAEAAAVAYARFLLATDSAGVVLANPLPESRQVDPTLHDRLVASGLAELARAGVTGKDVTPRLLEYFHENSAGESLRANVDLVLANAALAAEVAVELAALHRSRSA